MYYLPRTRAILAYFGHLEKLPVFGRHLKVEQSARYYHHMNTLLTKKIICKAVLDYYPKANLGGESYSRAWQLAFRGLSHSFLCACTPLKPAYWLGEKKALMAISDNDPTSWVRTLAIITPSVTKNSLVLNKKTQQPILFYASLW